MYVHTVIEAWRAWLGFFSRNDNLKHTHVWYSWVIRHAYTGEYLQRWRITDQGRRVLDAEQGYPTVREAEAHVPAGCKVVTHCEVASELQAPRLAHSGSVNRGEQRPLVGSYIITENEDGTTEIAQKWPTKPPEGWDWAQANQSVVMPAPDTTPMREAD